MFSDSPKCSFPFTQQGLVSSCAPLGTRPCCWGALEVWVSQNLFLPHTFWLLVCAKHRFDRMSVWPTIPHCSRIYSVPFLLRLQTHPLGIFPSPSFSEDDRALDYPEGLSHTKTLVFSSPNCIIKLNLHPFFFYYSARSPYLYSKLMTHTDLIKRIKFLLK